MHMFVFKWCLKTSLTVIYIYFLLILYFYTVFFLEIECKAHLKTLRWICAIEENKLLNYYYYLWKFFVLSLKTRKKFQRANLTSIRVRCKRIYPLFSTTLSMWKKMRIFCCFFFSTQCCIRIMCRSIISLQLLSEAEYDLNYAYRGLEGVRSRRRIFA